MYNPSETEKNSFETNYCLNGDTVTEKIKSYFTMKRPKSNGYDKESQDLLFNNPELSEDCFPFLHLNEEENDERHYFNKIENKKEKKVFGIINKNKVSLFTEALNDQKGELIDEDKYKNKTHSLKRQRRFRNQDNIRRVIKRRFLHTYLIHALNIKLKKAGHKKFFEIFSPSFAGKVSIEKEKLILEKTLSDIFSNKELYMEKNNILSNYKHNLEIIDQIKSNEDAELNIILNKKYSDIFEEYINSKEFIDEIQRLKNSKNKKDDNYIERYIYLSRHFIEFCSQ